MCLEGGRLRRSHRRLLPSLSRLLAVACALSVIVTTIIPGSAVMGKVTDNKDLVVQIFTTSVGALPLDFLMF